MAEDIKIQDINSAKRKILIVEDNDMNREILCALLEEEYDIMEAENGQVGLDVLRENYRDLSVVLLDVMMPVMDGYGFLREKGKDESLAGIPVIVTTANNTLEDEISCLQLGASDFVTKPYNTEIVKNRINSMLRLRESSAMLNLLEKDSLTGLFSKEFFYRYCDQIISNRPDNKFIILCSDVENFKVVNDRYGRDKGNDLLIYLAGKLPEILPNCILGGRLSGDIFAFLLEDSDKPGKEIFDVIIEESPVPNLVMKYGAYNVNMEELDTSSMCDRALLAIEQIKSRYECNINYYNQGVMDELLKRQQIIDHMEEALEEHQFQIYFQPKHDLFLDRTVGAEALVRWIHPVFGFMSPGLFIPIFEQNGFIKKLDLYVLENVCIALARWKEMGLPEISVSVNASRVDFEEGDLPTKVQEMANKYGVDYSRIHIEVTESAYTDNPQQIVDSVNELHDNGFKVELDDFGAGYSSLTNLKKMNLAVLKLDMSLIREDDLKSDHSILEFAIQLGKWMDMRTVAEGVETIEQVQRLKELGCDCIQGYYYSKPLPQDQFEEYLKKEAEEA